MSIMKIREAKLENYSAEVQMTIEEMQGNINLRALDDEFK
jgi:hypothetical protein